MLSKRKGTKEAKCIFFLPQDLSEIFSHYFFKSTVNEVKNTTNITGSVYHATPLLKAGTKTLHP
jgi:hypothetical protein